MTIEMLEHSTTTTELTANAQCVIKVIGVGGGGGNAVRHMVKTGIEGNPLFFCANTDAKALNDVVQDCQAAGKTPPIPVQLGDDGLGAGGKPDVGREAAKSSMEKINNMVKDAHVVFIAAGMGKGTGTGASPVIGKVAKETGALTIAVVTRPRQAEGKPRLKRANEGIQELRANVDCWIEVLNDNVEAAFAKAGKSVDKVLCVEGDAAVDDVLKNTVGAVIQIIGETWQRNVDFNDVKTVLKDSGSALAGIGLASGEGRVLEAAEQALQSPLLEKVDLRSAKGVIIALKYNPDNFTWAEKTTLENFFNEKVGGEDTELFYGRSEDKSMGDGVCVIVVAAGLQQEAVAHSDKGGVVLENAVVPEIPSGIQVVVSRTGTDDVAPAAPVIKPASTYNQGTVLQNAQAPMVVSPAAITPPPATASVAPQLYAAGGPSSVYGSAVYANIGAADGNRGSEAMQQQSVAPVLPQRYQQHQAALSSANTQGLATTRGDRQQQAQQAAALEYARQQQQPVGKTVQSNQGTGTRSLGNNDLDIPAYMNTRLAN